MGIGTGLGVAGIVSAGVGAAGSLGAASTQAGAAENAQQLQAQEAQNSLNFQEQQYNTEQQQAAPFLATGTQATTTLAQLLSTGGGGGLGAGEGGIGTGEGFSAGITPEEIGGVNYNLQTGGGTAPGSLLTPWNSQFQA